ncbi:MAG: DUF4129 domain-containing protein [Clostridia bacterium]|nr:DUF4129 domain-containing protein [Clostridia bacterium]
MKRIARKLLESLYFLLCFGPVPLIVGFAIAGDGYPLLIASAAAVPLAFLISILPGHVGGREKPQEAFMERSSSHGDPDPDRNLRRDTHEDVGRRGIRFPLRAFACVALMIGAGIWLFFGNAPWFGSLEYITRAVCCAIPVAMLPAALRFCTTASSVDTHNAIAGAAIYAVAGVAAFVIKSDALNALLSGCGAVFLAVTLWILNSRAMRTGAASRTGVKPPAAMRRRNRALLVGLMAFAAAVACWGWLKEKTAWLAANAAYWIGRIIIWILDHLYPGGSSSGGESGGGGMDFAGLGEETEPSPFWEAMTYVAYVVAAVAIVFLLFLMFRRIWRGLRSLAKKLSAYLSRFAQSVGEDYQDERESLLDWGEVQRDMGEAFKKRLASLFARDKKWDDMDERERARHLVRVLYRRARLKPDSRTLRETLPELRTNDPQALADVYELARYADREPDAAALEKLRRDVRA